MKLQPVDAMEKQPKRKLLILTVYFDDISFPCPLED